MVVKKSPLEFRLNGLIGRLAECGFIEWFESYSWFTINIAAFLPKQTKWMRYVNAQEQNNLSLQTNFFTMSHLRMAFAYYACMLAIATFVFGIEAIFTEGINIKFIVRPARKLLHKFKLYW